MQFGDTDADSGLFVNVGDNLLMSLSHAIQKIRATRNQEERLAMILKLILDNRAAVFDILKAYGPDKAKYTNRVLGEFKKMFEFQDKRDLLWGVSPQTRFFRDQDLARAAWLPFSRGMPSNRALLLLFMAKHLSKYPEINRFLGTRLNNSYSIYLTPHIQKIREYLGLEPG